jgi:hypothetical protein
VRALDKVSAAPDRRRHRRNGFRRGAPWFFHCPRRTKAAGASYTLAPMAAPNGGELSIVGAW